MYNDTIVPKQDLAEFGRVINDLMKPYNVYAHQHRILTASFKDTDSGILFRKTDHMSSVIIYSLKYTAL